MKLSIIIPVYNEEATIAKVLQKLLSQIEVTEIIIVNDGSTDQSEAQIKKFKNSKIKYFKKKNQGKGSAIRFGLSQVKGDYILIQDADLEYDPTDIPLMVAPIIEKGQMVVYGSRFLGPHSNLLFWHRLGNNFLNFVINILYNTTLSDMETCYKLMPTKLLRDLNLKAQKFDLEPEITCKILKRRIKIYEVPISYVGRDFSQGKKITWKDGFSALYTILYLRFFS